MNEVPDIARDEIEIGSIVQIVGGKYDGEYGKIAHFNLTKDYLVYVSLFKGPVPSVNAVKGTVFVKRIQGYTHRKTPRIRLVSK